MQFLTTRKIEPALLDALWKSIGWKERKNKWSEIITKSSFVLSVWDKGKLVGFGRILEDGIMCMLYDIGVHPDYQSKHKIGPKIMKILIGQVKNKKYASIGLFAWEENPRNIPFYKKFGFKRVNTGMELVKYMQRE